MIVVLPIKQEVLTF